MLENEIERHLVWHVARMGGVAYKFKSVNHRGVSDRIVCLPDGQTWFVELKTKGGRLAPLQRLFAQEMERMGQRYACLWTKDQVDMWAKGIADG
jgi:hypothetical protein